MIDTIKQEIKAYLENYYNEKYNVAINVIVEEPKTEDNNTSMTEE